MNKSNASLWFDEEIKPLEPSLRSWLNRQFQADTHVEDILQESYFRVLKAREKRVISYPKAYLYRTAHNVACDFLKDARVNCTDALEDTQVVDILVQPETTHEIIQRNHDISLLEDAIKALPKKCREIFTLRKVYDLSYKEIAAQLKISERTISAQMNIALRKCAAFIERNSD